MDNSQYADIFATAFKRFVITTTAEQGVTAPMLSKLTGISRANISRLMSEKSDPTQVSMANCYLICQTLGVSYAQVIYAIEIQLPPEDARRFVPKKARTVAKRMKPRVRAIVAPTPEQTAQSADRGLDLLTQLGNQNDE